jgi:hypothetical protein
LNLTCFIGEEVCDELSNSTRNADNQHQLWMVKVQTGNKQ